MNAIFKQNYTPELLIALKMVLLFGLRGNLDFPDFLHKKFLTSTPTLNQDLPFPRTCPYQNRHSDVTATSQRKNEANKHLDDDCESSNCSALTGVVGDDADVTKMASGNSKPEIGCRP